ncbi:MAG: hypothetical protein AMS18_09325 [Gemmatimonas sp. SG8_17]|nr:MAG: hypothetical protein AMS18_09325 [Gemmatimonas sp. SG8_17]
MLSKHCMECGVEAHPKLKHPSSLRVEAAVWLAAILVGLVAGAWSAATSSSAPSLSRALQVVTQSSAEPVEPPPESATVANPSTQSPQLRFALWARGVLLDFLRTAWWVLPLPLAFSYWRQFKKHQVCAACGSRRLAPVAVDYGELPPTV